MKVQRFSVPKRKYNYINLIPGEGTEVGAEVVAGGRGGVEANVRVEVQPELVDESGGEGRRLGEGDQEVGGGRAARDLGIGEAS